MGSRLAAEAVPCLRLGARGSLSQPPASSGGRHGGEIQSRTGAASGPEKATALLTLSLPLSEQVNNATARVMTNKKTANPYTNGKGPRAPGGCRGHRLGQRPWRTSGC